MTVSTSLGFCDATTSFPHPHSGLGQWQLDMMVVAAMHVLDRGRCVVEFLFKVLSLVPCATLQLLRPTLK